MRKLCGKLVTEGRARGSGGLAVQLYVGQCAHHTQNEYCKQEHLSQCHFAPEVHDFVLDSSEAVAKLLLTSAHHRQVFGKFVGGTYTS